MLIPIAVSSLAGIAALVAMRRNNTADPSVAAGRKVVFDTAINTVKDPAKLRVLSAAFRQVGETAEADMLEKRAALAEAPPDVKKERKAAYAKAMASTDSNEVRTMAQAFFDIGAMTTAKNLTDYADGLDALAPNTSSAAPVDAQEGTV